MLNETVFDAKNINTASFEKFASLLIIFLLFFSYASFCFIMVQAQTVSQLTGEIGSSSADYVWITNVKANDEVLITITPQEEDPHYESQIYASNLTQVSFDQGYTALYGSRTYYGMHNHEFVAENSGNYLLVITTDSNYSFSYTVKSELHQLKAQNMEKSGDTIGTSDTDYVWINNVKENELVLVCITPQSGEPYYQSSISIDQTEISYNQGYTATYGSRTYYGRHNHEFIAQQDGNYRLKIWTDSSNTFNYTLNVAHVNPNTLVTSPSETIPQPSQSIQTTTLPTASAIIYNPGATVTFKVPDDFPQVFEGQLVWDYGDGTVVSSNNRTTTHVYEKIGNYTFTLRIEGTPQERIIESYLVIIVVPSTDYGTLILTIISVIAGVVSAIIAVIAYIMPRQAQKKTKKGKK